MDGHVVIDDGECLTEISSDVFKALGVMAMVHLEADPTHIAENRSNDMSRSRPKYDKDTLGHPNMISGWKRAAIKNMADGFGKDDGGTAKYGAPEIFNTDSHMMTTSSRVV